MLGRVAELLEGGKQLAHLGVITSGHERNKVGSGARKGGGIGSGAHLGRDILGADVVRVEELERGVDAQVPARAEVVQVGEVHLLGCGAGVRGRG